LQKTVIIINGIGGSGKDAVCGITAKHYPAVNVSAIDRIKEAAKLLGWCGAKDLRDRKFLSDLQDISTEYNDLSVSDMLQKYNEFLDSCTAQILFIHMRKPADMKRFVSAVNGLDGRAATLIVNRSSDAGTFGNKADDEVLKYKYDYGFYNKGNSLEELEQDFMPLLDRIINEFSMEVQNQRS